MGAKYIDITVKVSVKGLDRTAEMAVDWFLGDYMDSSVKRAKINRKKLIEQLRNETDWGTLFQNEVENLLGYDADEFAGTIVDNSKLLDSLRGSLDAAEEDEMKAQAERAQAQREAEEIERIDYYVRLLTKAGFTVTKK